MKTILPDWTVTSVALTRSPEKYVVYLVGPVSKVTLDPVSSAGSIGALVGRHVSQAREARRQQVPRGLLDGEAGRNGKDGHVWLRQEGDLAGEVLEPGVNESGRQCGLAASGYGRHQQAAVTRPDGSGMKLEKEGVTSGRQPYEMPLDLTDEVAGRDEEVPVSAKGDSTEETFQEMKSRRVAAMESVYLENLLRKHCGNVTHSAAAAGMTRSAFQKLPVEQVK